ncbi:MAG: ABC transporter permease subunit [Propionibacteriaceae bacterium]|jgi:osmoprotectant transport system permease protein|nr:ABC transporter permease subunit [Propionibacteriaceae bacterium]
MKWLSQNWEHVIGLMVNHLLLAIPAIVMSVIIAVPLGRLAQQKPWLGKPLLSFATLMYAVPSLPLLVIIPSVLGLPLRSSATMIVALTLYGVALMVRTAADGFASIDQGTHEAAIAIGHSRRSLFWKVNLPLAIPVLASGVRVVVVSTIALVTIGALLGQSSLGTLLTDGFQRGIVAEVLTGVVLTIVLAVLLDLLVVLAKNLLAPWVRSGRAAV